MAENCSCIFGISAILGGQMQQERRRRQMRHAAASSERPGWNVIVMDGYGCFGKAPRKVIFAIRPHAG